MPTRNRVPWAGKEPQLVRGAPGPGEGRAADGLLRGKQQNRDVHTPRAETTPSEEGGRQVGTELLIPRPDLRRGPRAAPEHVPTLKHHVPQTITAATDRQESDVARGTNSHL